MIRCYLKKPDAPIDQIDSKTEPKKTQQLAPPLWPQGRNNRLKITQKSLTQFLNGFFRGDFPVEDWNSEFWKLQEEFAGVKAPVKRTQQDLDPLAIFHISQDFDTIRSSSSFAPELLV